MTDIENPFNSTYDQYQDNSPPPAPQTTTTTTTTTTTDVESQQTTSNTSVSNTQDGGLAAKMNISTKIAGWISIVLYLVGIILSFCSVAPNNAVGFFILYILGFGFGIFALFFYYHYSRIINMFKSNKVNLIIGIVYIVIFIVAFIMGCASRKLDVVIVIFSIVLWVGNFYFFFRLLPSGISGFFSTLF